MSLWESMKAFFTREAADVKEGLEGLKDRIDAELTRREAELEATPSERLDMIRDDIESDESVFDEIEAKIDGRFSRGEGIAEVVALEDQQAPEDND